MGAPAGRPVVITYPAFVAAVAGRDLDKLAARAGVPVSEIRCIIAGGWAAPRSSRIRLARALRRSGDVDALFRTVSVFDGGSADLEAAYPPQRFVTDAATLRHIDRRPA